MYVYILEDELGFILYRYRENSVYLPQTLPCGLVPELFAPCKIQQHRHQHMKHHRRDFVFVSSSTSFKTSFSVSLWFASGPRGPLYSQFLTLRLGSGESEVSSIAVYFYSRGAHK